MPATEGPDDRAGLWLTVAFIVAAVLVVSIFWALRVEARLDDLEAAMAVH